MSERQEELYRKRYTDIQFERLQLFEILRERVGDLPVIYAASSIHIAPTLFFQNVTYVDRSDIAQRFFSDRRAIEEITSGRKTYRQKPCVRFIHGDLTKRLPLELQRFRLCLSLYGGALFRYVVPYLAPDAFILTCDTFSDRDAVRSIPVRPRPRR